MHVHLNQNGTTICLFGQTWQPEVTFTQNSQSLIKKKFNSEKRPKGLPSFWQIAIRPTFNSEWKCTERNCEEVTALNAKWRVFPILSLFTKYKCMISFGFKVHLSIRPLRHVHAYIQTRCGACNYYFTSDYRNIKRINEYKQQRLHWAFSCIKIQYV